MASQVTLITKDPFDAKHLPIDSIRFAPDEKSFTFQVTTSLKRGLHRQERQKAKRNKVVYMNCDIASGNVTELQRIAQSGKISTLGIGISRRRKDRIRAPLRPMSGWTAKTSKGVEERQRTAQ